MDPGCYVQSCQISNNDEDQLSAAHHVLCKVRSKAVNQGLQGIAPHYHSAYRCYVVTSFCTLSNNNMLIGCGMRMVFMNKTVYMIETNA